MKRVRFNDIRYLTVERKKWEALRNPAWEWLMYTCLLNKVLHYIFLSFSLTVKGELKISPSYCSRKKRMEVTDVLFSLLPSYPLTPPFSPSPALPHLLPSPPPHYALPHSPSSTLCPIPLLPPVLPLYSTSPSAPHPSPVVSLFSPLPFSLPCLPLSPSPPTVKGQANQAAGWVGWTWALEGVSYGRCPSLRLTFAFATCVLSCTPVRVRRGRRWGEG